MNYVLFSSIATIDMKQLMSDYGFENQMKLSAMEWAGLLCRCKSAERPTSLVNVPLSFNIWLYTLTNSARLNA